MIEKSFFFSDKVREQTFLGGRGEGGTEMQGSFEGIHLNRGNCGTGGKKGRKTKYNKWRELKGWV